MKQNHWQHISFDCKCNFNSTKGNSDQKWNNNKCQCQCKKYHTCKKGFSWNPNTCICEKSSYLKSTVDDSVIVFDEIINFTDIVQQIWQTLYQQM